jgi:hypothetical protein
MTLYNEKNCVKAQKRFLINVSIKKNLSNEMSGSYIYLSYKVNNLFL